MTARPITAPQAPESIPAKPTRDEVIDAIRAETGITEGKASRFLNWLDGIVKRSRKTEGEVHYLTPGELRKHHGVLNAIAPDGAVAEPGTAHALVEQFLLNPGTGELGLLHDSEDEPGSATYCTVQVRLSVTR